MKHNSKKTQNMRGFVFFITCSLLLLESCSIYPSRKYEEPNLMIREGKNKVKIKMRGHNQGLAHKAFLKLEKKVYYDTIENALTLSPHFYPAFNSVDRHNRYFIVFYRPIKMKIDKRNYENIEYIKFQGQIKNINDTLK